MQEKIADKWKREHHETVNYYEKAIKALKVENR
jgi:predicted phage tail protein